MELGRFGVWTGLRPLGEGNAGEAARLVEDLGFATFWVGGSPRLPELRPLLEATTSLTVATAIVNVWENEPDALAAEHAELQRDFPDRVLLGLGVGHPEAASEYARPLGTMRSFLDGLDAATSPVGPARRCLAALGPRMLDLSAERSLGTIPYFVPVEHTRRARERVGPGVLVAPEVACVIDTDPAAARATARRYTRLYLGLRNYTANLARLGYSDEDLADAGSDRLVDDVIPHGSAEDVAAVARAHLQAGADHVCLQPLGERGIPREGWTALAAALGA